MNTSLEAYREAVPPIRHALWERVLAYVVAHPGCTQADVSRELGESGRKRIAELVGRKAGELSEGGPVQRGRLWYTTYTVRTEDAEVEQLRLFA